MSLYWRAEGVQQSRALIALLEENPVLSQAYVSAVMDAEVFGELSEIADSLGLASRFVPVATVLGRLSEDQRTLVEFVLKNRKVDLYDFVDHWRKRTNRSTADLRKRIETSTKEGEIVPIYLGYAFSSNALEAMLNDDADTLAVTIALDLVEHQNVLEGRESFIGSLALNRAGSELPAAVISGGVGSRIIAEGRAASMVGKTVVEGLMFELPAAATAVASGPLAAGLSVAVAYGLGEQEERAVERSGVLVGLNSMVDPDALLSEYDFEKRMADASMNKFMTTGMAAAGVGITAAIAADKLSGLATKFRDLSGIEVRVYFAQALKSVFEADEAPTKVVIAQRLGFASTDALDTALKSKRTTFAQQRRQWLGKNSDTKIKPAQIALLDSAVAQADLQNFGWRLQNGLHDPVIIEAHLDAAVKICIESGGKADSRNVARVLGIEYSRQAGEFRVGSKSGGKSVILSKHPGGYLAKKLKAAGFDYDAYRAKTFGSAHAAGDITVVQRRRIIREVVVGLAERGEVLSLNQIAQRVRMGQTTVLPILLDIIFEEKLNLRISGIRIPAAHSLAGGSQISLNLLRLVEAIDTRLSANVRVPTGLFRSDLGIYIKSWCEKTWTNSNFD